MLMKYKSLLLIILLSLLDCKSDQKKQLTSTKEGISLQLKYAKGFSVIDYGTYKIL